MDAKSHVEGGGGKEEEGVPAVPLNPLNTPKEVPCFNQGVSYTQEQSTLLSRISLTFRRFSQGTRTRKTDVALISNIYYKCSTGSPSDTRVECSVFLASNLRLVVSVMDPPAIKYLRLSSQHSYSRRCISLALIPRSKSSCLIA